MSPLRPGKTSSGPQLARPPITVQNIYADNDIYDHHPSGSFRARADSSSSRLSFSSSFNQKTPARSFFHRSIHGSSAPIDVAHSASQDVRDDTAQLASWASPDMTSQQNTRPIARQHSHTSSITTKSGLDLFRDHLEQDTISRQRSNDTSRPDVIEEVVEPPSPDSIDSTGPSPPTSILSEQIRKSPSVEHDSNHEEDDISFDGKNMQPAVVGRGIISQPNERTALLLRRTAYGVDNYGCRKDLESQRMTMVNTTTKVQECLSLARERGARVWRSIATPKSWDKRDLWVHGIREPASNIPCVILGLLLNILDALSYGMILFPLGQPIFEDLGPDGISMFYVSCIVSQLVYSCGGSIFKGGIGSEMIEVVPFFHKMAFIILARVGEDNPSAVLATTVVSYSLSSILTGAVFYTMGRFRIGTLIGFFPRHILVGCIGGVGWFLVATGLEVSARLDGNLEFNLLTLHKLVQPDTIALWLIPLVLAIILFIIKHWVKHPLTDATFFISIIAIFYFFVAAIDSINLSELRNDGWVFPAPKAGVPFYHFYSLYDFGAVDWKALGATVPAMLALTFFGILHVPINVPALGLTTGEDNVDVDRELRAHGYSNALSGLCGSIQNYLVYTNSILFMRSGGNSRVAGIMLAAATFAILVVGPVIIGYVPIMVVGALIFFLGFDLLREALVDTWGRVHRLEYLTIIVIVVTMGAWDFVIGILVGILLACVSFVLQTSRVSAIRGNLPGGVANSTVRRHPIQHRFLHSAGQQTHVMKLAGYLFFGTIVGVEKHIRDMLQEKFQRRPIRFLVLDLYNVDGVDFSAAEAFTRINRILKVKGVELVICGIKMDGEVGTSLCNVGLFNEDDGALYCESLNSALEYCENELLKSFYQQQMSEPERESGPSFLEIPKRKQSFSQDSVFSSPRRNHLHQVATNTLENSTPPTKWQNHNQPLQLILQTFSSLSTQPEFFWRRLMPFFVRRSFPTNSTLYRRGDPANGFYLLEQGILKADYDLQQGKYTELIVERTTCGELPFFSGTERTSTTTAERDCVTWLLDEGNWASVQREEPELAQELLKISLKLTSERMDAITSYMLLTSG